MRSEIIRSINENKMIVIARGIEPDDLLKSAEALYAGGVRLIEVTFDQSGRIPEQRTLDEIEMLGKAFSGRMYVGAGTVMSCEQVMLAKKSGATFIVSPDACEEVIRCTVEQGLVSVPGAVTPTEIANAHRWGADFVKIFPCEIGGANYIRHLRGPLNHIKLLAVGGINEDNVADYLAAGVDGIGIGSGILRKELIREGRFDELTALGASYDSMLKRK